MATTEAGRQHMEAITAVTRALVAMQMRWGPAECPTYGCSGHVVAGLLHSGVHCQGLHSAVDMAQLSIYGSGPSGILGVVIERSAALLRAGPGLQHTLFVTSALCIRLLRVFDVLGAPGALAGQGTPPIHAAVTFDLVTWQVLYRLSLGLAPNWRRSVLLAGWHRQNATSVWKCHYRSTQILGRL